jgi:hypothetical protein
MTSAHSQTIPENDPAPPQPEITQSPETPPEPAPMLDVHPAHHAASTWRDFFIHIATIVLGLLIAISLEQTVEYFHHRHLAREASEQLRLERVSNETSNEFNIYTTQRHQRDLQRDLAILRAVKTHTSISNGPFIVRRHRYVYIEDVWRKIHQSGTINYLTENLQPIAYRYGNQDDFMSRVAQSDEALSHASSILRSENDPPRTSFEGSLASARFTRALVDSHETMSEDAVRQGFADLVEHADLSQVTPTHLDELERAIKVALADDDALLAYCFNIKRNLQNNPVK